MAARLNICFFVGAILAQYPLALSAQSTPRVEKPLQRAVELDCRLDIFTPMLYEGIISDIGGSKTTLTFNQRCAEIRSTEYAIKTGKAPMHSRSLLMWSKGLLSDELRVNDNVLKLSSGELSRPLRIVPFGRMSLVDLGSSGYLYDNTEQHWCPFALTFPTKNVRSSPLYWYDKNSQNIVRFYQDGWASPVTKTQHYLPAACSSSRTPAPIKPIVFKFGTNIPVNVYTGPVVVSY